jgi:hypothetical protein
MKSWTACWLGGAAPPNVWKSASSVSHLNAPAYGHGYLCHPDIHFEFIMILVDLIFDSLNIQSIRVDCHVVWLDFHRIPKVLLLSVRLTSLH